MKGAYIEALNGAYHTIANFSIDTTGDITIGWDEHGMYAEQDCGSYVVILRYKKKSIPPELESAQ